MYKCIFFIKEYNSDDVTYDSVCPSVLHRKELNDTSIEPNFHNEVNGVISYSLRDFLPLVFHSA